MKRTRGTKDERKGESGGGGRELGEKSNLKLGGQIAGKQRIMPHGLSSLIES